MVNKGEITSQRGKTPFARG